MPVLSVESNDMDIMDTSLESRFSLDAETKLNDEELELRLEGIEETRDQLEALGALDKTEAERAEAAIWEVQASRIRKITHLEIQLNKALERAQNPATFE